MSKTKKLMNTLWERFIGHDIPFRKKLTRVSLVVFILPMVVLAFYLSSYTAELLEEQLHYAATANFDQTQQYLEAVFSSYDTLSFTISRNSSFQQLYREQSILNSLPPNEVNLMKREMESQLYTTISRMPVDGFSIYLSADMGCFADDTIFYTMDSIVDEVWQQELTTYFYRHRRTFLICPPGWVSQSGTPAISFARAIFNLDNYWELFGLVKIDFPLSDLVEIMQKNSSVSGTVSYIINYGQEIVVSDGDITGADGPVALWDLIPYKSVNYAEDWSDIEIEGQNYIFRQIPIGRYKVNLVTLIPVNSIRNAGRDIQIRVLVVLLVLSVLAILIFSNISEGLITRIRLLIDRMNKTNKGILARVDEHAGSDELGKLIENYNNMVANMEILIDDKYKSGMELKNYELQVLQEQINPHFLYNTLEMINWLTKSGKNKQASAAVTALAQFYRTSLGDGASTITLKQELEHIQAYIDLQNMRFGNSLSYQCTLPDNAEQLLIPKTILQPVIENAVIHGIMEKESGEGSILVYIEEHSDTIVIVVRDDGVGMDSSQVNALNSRRDLEPSSGYGVRNVDSRIRLLYGDNYGVHFESEPGKSTTVFIKLPINKK